MSDPNETITVRSSRFGDLVVPRDSVIEFPSGVIGFPKFRRYIMVDHKPPFSWLQSLDESSLAFVVVDGFEFGQEYDLSIPLSYAECDFREDDEYAILIIVTVRSDPRFTTANLKAPIFVNVRNKKGVQVIYDDTKYSTRYPLWEETEEGEQAKKGDDPK